MASVNKVILLGNLGQDPEVKYMPSGGAVVNISIATTDSWKDKSTGEKQERTEWHRVSFFNRLAEIVGEYVKKGDPLYIEGRIQTRKWQDQDGQDKYTTEIIANTMQMLSSKSNSGAEAKETPKDQQPRRQTAGSAVNGESQQGNDNFDDDIPF